MAGIPEPLEKIKVAVIDMGFVVQVDAPANPLGEWWLNIFAKDRTDCLDEIVYSPGGGFGFFAEDAGFGSKPAELVATVKQAFPILMTRLTKRLAQ